MNQIYIRSILLMSLLNILPVGFCQAKSSGTATVLDSSVVDDKQAATTVSEVEARTFILSNESPGYLIDNLIAAGYGDSCLYAVMQYLQPLSGGVVPQWFMNSLAACPANSDIFTAELFNFSDPSNNPVGIGEDGSVIIAGIYGRDWSGKEGYTTFNDTLVSVSLKLFTKAIGPEYYIDAGTTTIYNSSVPITTHYKAFAIAWSMGSTFILSNEGGLIEDLIRAGHSTKNLYQTLEVLKPKSGGVISDEFMATLANCPAESDIFTAELSNFSNAANNPIAINTDGTIHVVSIYGKDYFQSNEFKILPEIQNGYSSELFTYATKPDKYIDAGSSNISGGNNYKAFAIAWKSSTTFVLSNEGGLIDDLIRAGNGDKNLYQTLQILKPKSGGVISDEFMATLANCPAGSEIFTAALSNFGGLNNPICVNTDGTLRINAIFGKDYLSKDGYSTHLLNQGGYTTELFTDANSAENYIDAGASSSQSRYKAFAIAWKASTTFILSNEGGLIDDLIRAGHGDKNLYQTLEVLKPKSGGIISDEFMATLANCPAGSDIFTAALSNFAGLNNPVCVNSDGTMRIAAIFGNDYLQREGYYTFPENQEGYSSALFTASTSSDKYIDIGLSGQFYFNYKAFAIAWKSSTTFVLTNEGGLIDSLIAGGYGNSNIFETLYALQDMSGGVISDEFIETLAKCPNGSDIFTAELSNFAELNNPVCINTDGTLGIRSIFGKDYYGNEGYLTYPEIQSGVEGELFTFASSPLYYIDAGANVANSDVYRYKAFAIAWSEPATITVNPAVLNIGGSNGSTATFTITSNDGWTITPGHGWLAAIPASGTGNATVTLTAQGNPQTTERTDTVKISATGGEPQIVVVTQSINTGVNTLKEKEFEIYPNPTNGKFRVLSSEFKVQRVEVVDLNGKVLESFTSQPSFNEMSFDI